jgi:hypothetical protein
MRTILLIFLAFSLSARSQVNLKDSSIAMPLLGFNYSFFIPGGDLSNRFGNSSAIGGTFLYKTRSNFVFGADWNYIFGTKVKESGLFVNITSNTGSIIDKSGLPAEIRLYQRGYLSSLKFGKILNFLSPNPNSGIIVMVSAGYLQHKIRIEDVNNTVPQVDGDYAKGYDRLTSGFCISQFAGFVYLSNNRLINFFAGFEAVEGYTMSRRSYDFDKMKRDTQKRKDILYGIKAGWILPLYKKAPKQFYYY